MKLTAEQQKLKDGFRDSLFPSHFQHPNCLIGEQLTPYTALWAWQGYGTRVYISFVEATHEGAIWHNEPDYLCSANMGEVLDAYHRCLESRKNASNL